MSRVFLILTLALTAFCRAEDASYEMHEWGVFPVPRNSTWAMIDTRADLASMPKFFLKVWPDQHLPWRGPVRKPVIYFYAEKPLSVELKVRFADGKPLVWWPAAESPAGGIQVDHPEELHFNLRVGHFAPPDSHLYKTFQADDDNSKAIIQRLKELAPPKVEKGHWLEALRIPSASLLYTYGSYGRGLNSESNDPVEKFIYYDGIMKAPVTPQVARDGEALVMKSNFSYAISDVMVIDRANGKTRVAKAWPNVAAGEQSTRIEMVAADGVAAMKGLTDEFIKHLVAAGLTQEESVGLEKVWHDGMFLRDGISVVYRVPQEIYDQWLPLTAKPAPKKIVRVGLVFHEHLEPELDANVKALIKKLAAEEFTDRQQAMQALMNIGGAAFTYLEEAINGKDTELEVAANCRKIMEALDVRPAMNPQPAKAKR